MMIGFIGFGKVSQNLVKLIDSSDITFVTSSENRSFETMEAIKNSNVCVEDSFKDVAIKSDILISANSPSSALEVAKQYGKYSSGLYLDLNNISPDTVLEIGRYVDNIVDGAIIGKIDSDNPILYVSGESAKDLIFLNEFLNIKVISGNIGDASKLKLLRSTYTKTLSALLIESADIAKSNNLEEEFFDILALTEGELFREKSVSRIKNTINNSKRKSEELEEIIDYFGSNDLTMVRAALEKLNRL